MNTRFLLNGAIAGMAALSTGVMVAPAQALYDSEPEVIAEYNVMEYATGKHAVWLHGLYQDGYATSNSFVFGDTPGMFTVYDNGTANLMGTVVSSDSDAADEIWDVNINLSLWDGFDGPLKGAKYYTGSSSASEDWSFYDFVVDEAILSATEGQYAGSTLQLERKGQYAVQVGQGANDKNKYNGLSTWFDYSGKLVVDGEEKAIGNTRSDINVKFTKKVPEPMSLLGLGAAAVGIVGLKRRQGQTQEG